MKKDTIVRVLKDIGLSDNEAQIYYALLMLGPSKAGEISKYLQLNRTSVYDALKRLGKNGLVGHVVISNVKWFKPVDPSRLMELLEERRDRVEQVMPDMEKMYKAKKLKSSVTLFKGYKGIKSVFKDILKEASENRVFGSEGQFTERMEYFAQYFVREVERNDIHVRNIVREGRDVKPSKTTKVRYVPEEVESPVVTNIYADKMAIILWTEEPEAILIENKAAAETYKNYFELLWNIARK